MKHLLAIFLILFLIFFEINTSMETRKEKNYNFLDYDDFNSNYLDEKCSENQICQNNMDEIIKRKTQESDDFLYRQDFNGKKTAHVPAYYHSSRPLSCSCGIEFKVLDLGHQYYPRYLHTGVCKSDICGGVYRCIEKHYKVRVLKQRDPRNSEIKTPAAFPENLKGIWQPELVTVTVACECSL